MNRHRAWSQGGFTLLEAIVTLIIVSMLVTVLMSALSQSLSLRTRMLRVQGEARQMSLQEAWFRESVGGAQPPAKLGESDGFWGTESGLSFVSAAPLAADGSARVDWRLERDSDGQTALHYQDPVAGDMVVMQGPLRDASLSYMADGGSQWQMEWRSTSPDKASPLSPAGTGMLPRLVRFQATTATGRRLHWLVYLPADLHASDRIDLSEVGHGL